MERRARDSGTGYYWHPGDTLPNRAPDLSKIWGGEAEEARSQVL